MNIECFLTQKQFTELEWPIQFVIFKVMMVNQINDHRRHSVSNSHFYDVIGIFDSEPTIIDALKYLARKCCCCSKCGQVNYNYSNYNSNKWDYSIEDEVQIAMRERQNNSNYELKKAFLENNNRNTDQYYDILDSVNQINDGKSLKRNQDNI